MAKKKTVGVSMLGCGTVGLPLFRMLSEAGMGFQVRTVVVGNPGQSKYDALRGISGLKLLSSQDFDASNGRAIFEDPGTDVVVEVMGGSKNTEGNDPYEKTRDRLLAAIRAKKHVVTANKTVISFWGPEMFDTAAAAKVNVFYEAAVGGSIPIIRLLRSYWRKQRIRKVMGILNGTCNYILSRMPHFRDADAPMPDAQRLGRVVYRRNYPMEKNGAMLWALDHARVEGLAEADPSFDLDGHDAAQKLALLASLAFHTFIPPVESNIPRSSIRSVTLEDLDLADGLGFVIKPLAVAQREGDSVELRVHPCLLPKKHPLASVSEAYNAIYVESEPREGCQGFGEQLYYGKGAGGDATATALFSDLIEASFRIQHGIVENPDYHRSSNRLKLLPGDEQASPGYIKSASRDVPGIFMHKTRILYGDQESERINIHQIYNLHQFRRNDLVPDVITIWPTRYRFVRQALRRFVEAGVSAEEPVFLRIER
ncbi:MAG: hypothetical protein HYU36_24300 [Planctomycetes bacterium]|nr:hypothetical protein [Planctomycetota bacterium]